MKRHLKPIDENKPIIYLAGKPLFNDIKYRGPLSYREMRIFAFLFLLVSQVAGIVLSANKFLNVIPNSFNGTLEVLKDFGMFSLPMFLMASFAIVLANEDKLINTMLFYFSVALGIYLAIILFYGRYLKGLLGLATGAEGEDLNAIADSIASSLFSSVVNINVFIDMFILSVFAFFILYTPKKIKKKGAVLAFRLCSIIPVLIAFGSSVIYGLINLGKLKLGFLVMNALPCRSISVYIIFFAIVLFVKLKKARFLKKGGTEEEYAVYSASNINSLHYSLFVSVLLVAVFLFDLFIFYVFPISIFFGYGTSFYMFVIIPFVMLFSYTRTRKNKVIDIIIPFVYIGLFALIIVELTFQLLLTA